MPRNRTFHRGVALAIAASLSPLALPASAHAATGSETGSASQPRTVVIHTVEKAPDEERGVVKLAMFNSTSRGKVGTSDIVMVNFEELCSMPCGVPIDVSERPVLFFVRDGRAVSKGFRVPVGADEFTIKVKPIRSSMHGMGVVLIALIATFPIGIPLVVVGKSRTWISQGAPGEDNEFVRLKGTRI